MKLNKKTLIISTTVAMTTLGVSINTPKTFAASSSLAVPKLSASTATSNSEDNLKQSGSDVPVAPNVDSGAYGNFESITISSSSSSLASSSTSQASSSSSNASSTASEEQVAPNVDSGAYGTFKGITLSSSNSLTSSSTNQASSSGSNSNSTTPSDSSSSNIANSDNLIHLIDSTSGKEVGTISQAELQAAMGSSKVLGGTYYLADWNSDIKQSNIDNTYNVITADEYQKEVNALTVVVKYIDLSTNKLIKQRSLLLSESVPYSDLINALSLPEGFELANKSPEETIENDNNIVYVYLNAVVTSSASSTASMNSGTSNNPTITLAMSNVNLTTKTMSIDKMHTLSNSAFPNAITSNILPKTNESKNLGIYILGIVITFFALIISFFSKKYKKNL